MIGSSLSSFRWQFGILQDVVTLRAAAILVGNPMRPIKMLSEFFTDFALELLRSPLGRRAVSYNSSLASGGSTLRAPIFPQRHFFHGGLVAALPHAARFGEGNPALHAFARVDPEAELIVGHVLDRSPPQCFLFLCERIGRAIHLRLANNA